MSFITMQHTNPGKVSKRLDRWIQIEHGNLVQLTVNSKLDQLYDMIFKVTPVKTGYMRSTLAVRSGNGYAELVITARYARYVESGTRYSRGRHFFFPNVAQFSVEIIIAVRNLYASTF